MSEVLSGFLNFCNKTNKCTCIKYVLSHISFQHVLIAFVIISRVTISPWYSCTDELILPVGTNEFNMFHIHALKEYLYLHNKTNKYTCIKYSNLMMITQAIKTCQKLIICD